MAQHPSSAMAANTDYEPSVPNAPLLGTVACRVTTTADDLELSIDDQYALLGLVEYP